MAFWDFIETIKRDGANVAKSAGRQATRVGRAAYSLTGDAKEEDRDKLIRETIKNLNPDVRQQIAQDPLIGKRLQEQQIDINKPEDIDRFKLDSSDPVKDFAVSTARSLARTPETFLRSASESGAKDISNRLRTKVEDAQNNIKAMPAGPEKDRALAEAERLKGQLPTDFNSGEANSGLREFLYGKEKVETYQTRAAGNKKVIEGSRFSPLAGIAGPLTGVLTVAGDLPTGGKLVKDIGEEGVKKLAVEAGEEGVKSLLKGKVKTAVAEKLAPLLAKASTEEEVASILNNGGAKLAKDVGQKLAGSTQVKNATGDLLQPKQPADFVNALNPKIAPEVPTPTLTPPTSAIPPVKPTGKSAGDELLSRLYSTSDIEKLKDKPSKLQNTYDNWFNKNSALDEFNRIYKSKTGEDLATEMDPAKLIQLSNGRDTAAAQRLTGVQEAIKQSGDYDAVRKLGVARQVIDREADYPAETVDIAKRTIAELQQTMDPQALSRVDGAVGAVRNFYDQQLKDLVDIGRISPETKQVIQEANPNYFGRVSLIEHILDEGNAAKFSVGASHNQARENIIKAVKGFENDDRFKIQDPIEGMVKSALTVQKAVEDTKAFKAIKNFTEIDPENFKVIRASDDVLKRMGLSLENKELRPIRDLADRMIKTRGRTIGKLQTEMNNLEKKGLNISLKEGGNSLPTGFTPAGLGGEVATSQAGKATSRLTPDELAKEIVGATKPTALSPDGNLLDGAVNPSKLGKQDTESFLRSLVTGPNKDIVALRKKIGTRDANVSKLLDDVEELQGKYHTAATQIADNSADARALMDAEVPKGYKVISSIQNGIVERVSVPEPIYNAFTGMNDAQKEIVGKTMQKVGKFAKSAFTTYNPAFSLITNPIRDISTSAFTSKAIPVKDYALVLPYAKKWVKSFWGALTDDETAVALRRAGAGNAGQFTSDLNPEKFAKNLKRATNGREVHSAKDFLKEITRAAGAPGRTIKRVGTAIEEATRGAEARAILAKSGSIEDAALGARRVSTDFVQGGKHAQEANTFLNFFNARIQGTKNVVSAIKDNPKRAGAVITATIAVPTATTYMYNTTAHGDVWDQIDQTTKDNNYIFIYGDGVDEKGHPNQFVTVPKNEVQKMFSNPIENGLKALRGEQPESFSKIATKMLSNFSPVDIQKDGELNLSRTVGGLLPSAVAGPVGYATNKNLYNDSPIVPDSMKNLPAGEQVRDTTSGVDKFLGALIPGEQSPLKIEAVRRGLTGGLISNPVAQLSAPLTANANAPTSEFYKLKSKVDKNRASASAHINEALSKGDVAGAQATAEAYNAYLVKTYSPFGEKYGKYMTDDLIEQYDKLKLNLTKRSIKQRQKSQLEKQSR